MSMTKAQPYPEWEDGFDDDEPDDFEDEGWDECGMTPSGQCTLAGTEWCDWDCPRNKPCKPAGRAALTKETADDR